MMLFDNPWLHGLILGALISGTVMAISGFWVFIERRFSALMQLRRGPVWVGPQGIFQIVADALKMLQKEDITPREADKLLFNLAPILPMFLVLGSIAVVPISGTRVDGEWGEDGEDLALVPVREGALFLGG